MHTNPCYLLPRRLVDKLNDLRDQEQGPHVPNRLDTLLADVFSLLSLFFLTIGKGRECPATYSQIASMRVSLIFCFISLECLAVPYPCGCSCRTLAYLILYRIYAPKFEMSLGQAPLETIAP